LKAGNSNGWSEFSESDGGYIRSSLISYEGFNYSDTEDVKGQNGGVGWLGAWYADKGTIISSGLNYKDVDDNFLVVTGNAATNSGQTTCRYFATNGFDEILVNENGTNKFGKDGTELWLSFLGHGSSYKDDFSLSLHDGGSWGANQTVAIGSFGNNEKWYCKSGTKSNSGPEDKWSEELAFLVMKCNFVSGLTNDSVKVWINPDFGDEPTNNYDISLSIMDIGQFTRLRCYAKSGNTNSVFTYDEIRLGETWASVTPSDIPEPILIWIIGLLGFWIIAKR